MRSMQSQRGSVLIVALLLAAVIAISLTSYIHLSVNALKLANRSFYSNGAMNLLDSGFEQALWSLNNATWTGSAGFAAGATAGQYQGTFPSAGTYYSLSGGVKGQVKVWVDTTFVTGGTSTPHVIASSTITLPDGTVLVKLAEAYLQQRTYTSEPMVARTGLSFTGNVRLDSWDSHSDTATAGDDVAYSNGVANTEAGIASASISVNSVSLQNADVYGRASVGTTGATGISVGSGGRLAGSFSAGTGIDYSRVTYDFTTSFPDISQATGNINPLAPITGTTTLPVAGSTTTVKDGKTYYIYSVSSIALNGGDQVNITAGTNVIINVTGATGTTVQTTGNAGINLPAAATLQMYVSGNVQIAGNGVMNGGAGAPNNPLNFQLFGTRSAANAAISGIQNFDIKGNGYLSAVVNAPNANIFVNGNGDTYGSMLGNHVTLVGNGNFHADESLGRIATTGLWGLVKWREISSASDRAANISHVSF